MSEKQPDIVPLPAILRAALSSRQPGEDLDEAILRALKAVHPEHATMLFSAAAGMIDMEVKLTGEDREQVVKRLAAEESGRTVTTWTETTQGGQGSATVFIERFVGKGSQSLDKLPPDVRRAIEEQLGRGGKLEMLLNELPPDARRAIEEQLGRGEKVRLMLGDLPPEARRAIEARQGRDEKVRVVRGAGSTARTGCSMALLAALWKLVVR